jgi:hypothetical protein
MKIPSCGREFSSYNSKGKDGKLPYLYESDILKLERIRSVINEKTFKKNNTAKNEYFGFGKLNQNSKSLAASKMSRIMY